MRIWRGFTCSALGIRRVRMPFSNVALAAALRLVGALAADRQRATLDGDLDVLRLPAGERRLDHELVSGARDVERHEGPGVPVEERGPLAGTDEAVLEQAVHRGTKC